MPSEVSVAGRELKESPSGTGRHKTQASRYTIKLDSYDGKRGGAASWYRNVKLTLDAMKIPSEERYPMWQGLLTGQAKTEHHLHLQEMRREESLETVDVEVFVDRLVEKFDVGQHEYWLEKLSWIKQTRSEDYFVFEARFLQVIDGLRAYGHLYTDEQLVL